MIIIIQIFFYSFTEAPNCNIFETPFGSDLVQVIFIVITLQGCQTISKDTGLVTRQIGFIVHYTGAYTWGYSYIFQRLLAHLQEHISTGPE